MTDVIVRPRQAGKTHELAAWVAAGEERDAYPYWTRVLLVHNINEADRVRKEYDLDYRQVFSFNEWRGRHGGRMSEGVEIAVDNLDILLCDMFGFLPSLVAVNGVVKP